MLMPLLSAFGYLETPRIGLEINLTENYIINNNISIYNPLNESLKVFLTSDNLINIETNESLKIDLQIDNFILNAYERKAIPFYIEINNSGKYEGKIKVSFSKITSNNTITLNSIIQVLAYNKKNKFKNNYNLILIMTILIILALLAILFFILLKGGIKNEQTNSNIIDVS